MPYRSLLVHLDGSARCDVRARLAAGLSREWGSHLVGLAPIGPMLLATDPMSATADLELLALAATAQRDQARDSVQRFLARCAQASLGSVETVIDEEDDAASLVRHGHCSDLVVLGQADPGQPDHARAWAMVEHVVLHAARPTLVVPHAGPVQTLGERVLVAWDDSREAARAAADALPLLCRARQVDVVQFEAPSAAPAGSENAPALRRLDALRQWLAWHGVDADVRLETIDIDVGNALLSHAADLGSDLLVMGAYGQPRWSERVLGGATRTVLSSMTVPVLMSH